MRACITRVGLCVFQVAELEAQSVVSAGSDPDLSQSVETLEDLLRTKDQVTQTHTQTDGQTEV